MRYFREHQQEQMSTTLSEETSVSFASLNTPVGVFNEAFDANGNPRSHWMRLLNEFEKFSTAELSERARQASEHLVEDGANYNVFGEETPVARPWDLDLIPFVASTEEWSKLEIALDQRARLIDAVIRDLYGPRELIQDGTLPPEVIFAHPGYLRACSQLRDVNESAVTLYSSELARAADGRWWVMADRLDAPSGPAYTLENRIVSSHSLPQLTHRIRIQRLAPFFVRLLNSLKQRCLRNVENPHIVLLSSGAKNPFYFEDVYLARYLGINLVQGGDLAARDGKIYLKTLAGLSVIDVILNRGHEQGIDPLELGGGAVHGVPGLLDAVRKGNVVVANRPGSGMLESPVFMAFLPTLCQRLFGEDLKAPSIATWWCGDPGALQKVLQRLPELVIKPAFQASGGDEYLGDRLSKIELDELRSKIIDRPYNFVAQERISRSTAPVWRGEQAVSGHVAVRTFLVNDKDRFHILPGGFVRTAEDSGPMELSITAGSASKDLWVLADGPVAPVSLLLPQDRPVELKRSGAMFPSRTADDLFWLGISLERADFLMRLNRAVIERLTSESDHEQSELFSLLRALAKLGQINSAVTQLEPSMAFVEVEDQFGHALFDAKNLRGIANAISEMLRLASLTRDLLSQDTWRKIHQSAHWYLAAPRRGVDDLGEVHSELTTLGANLAAVSGLIHDGMIRGPSWRFLDMGRRIERARVTCRFLLTLIQSENIASTPLLKAILEVIDSRMTYRFRYLDNVQANAVLDLAITDETNPHSVGFQLSWLESHVDALPTRPNLPLRTEEKRHLMSAIHSVRMLTPESLANPDLVETSKALSNVSSRMKDLSDTITRNFLVHSGPLRQITGQGETA